MADNKKFLEEAQDLVKAVKKQVDNVPDSPAKTEMTAKLDKLEPALANVTQQSAQLSSMLQPFKTLLAQHPETQPALQPLLDHLAELDEKTRDDSQVVAKITAESQKTLKSCDTIDQSTQALKALSEVLDRIHEPFEFATAYASGLAKPASPQSGADMAAKAANLAHGLSSGGESKSLAEANHYAEGSIIENGIELGSETALANKLLAAIPASVRTSDGYKCAVAEAKKFTPRVIEDGDNVIKQLLNAAALVTDAATYANEKFFARYCQKFEGTFTATMKAYFYAKGFEHNELADATLREAVTIREKSPDDLWELALARERLGETLAQAGSVAAPEILKKAAHDLESQLGADHPETLRAKATLARIHT